MTKDCVLSQQMSQGEQVSDQFGSNVVITMKSGLKAPSYTDVTFESFPVDGNMTIKSGGGSWTLVLAMMLNQALWLERVIFHLLVVSKFSYLER